jgi:ABC-2 type transport system permease protein
MHTFWNLTRNEARLTVRDRGTLLFALLLPTGLLLGLGAAPALREPSQDFGGMRFIDYFAPSLVVMIVAIMGISALPTAIATYRERGMLRRMRTTPVHPAQLLGAQLLVSLATSVIATLLVIVLGRLVYGVPLPEHPFGFAIAFVLGMGAVFAIGMLVAARAPNTRVATGFATVVFMTVMFFGGVYVPRFLMPDVIVRVGEYTPPGVQSLLDSWNGTAPAVGPLLIMSVTALVFGAVSARVFKWE